MDVDDMIGRKFGALKVLCRTYATSSLAAVTALCDCGEQVDVAARDLRCGAVRRCGKCCLMVTEIQFSDAMPDNESQRRKQIAAENRMRLETKREHRKQARIDRMNRQLAAAKSINRGNG